jgi:hypothetical protein
MFYTGSGPLHVETPDAFDDPALSTQACTPKWTHVNLRLEIDTKSRPVPPNTRVFVSGDAPDQTRYVKDDGRLDFEFGCGRRIHFRVYAFTSTGMYLHTHTPGSLASWLKTILPGYGAPDFTADSIRNATVMTTEASDATVSRWIQRIWFRINQVYNWERSAHSVYSTFPLSTFYPSNDYFNNVRSRAAVGQIQLVDSDADSDITIVHEFGHEVYYRRLLGASEYNIHQKAMEGQAAFPICAGATYWQIWKFTDGCAGMLEGFALWFDAVATRVLGVGSRDSQPYDIYDFPPDIRPTTNAPKGAAVPGRVAQYLWDVTDVHGDNSGMKIQDEDSDAVKDYRDSSLSLSQDLNRRYAKVASFFYDAAPNQDFNYMWRYHIRAKLTDTQEANHCKVLVYNTLGGVYGCP